MRELNLQPLSLGRSTFHTLRGANCIYVDKTELIYDLCRFGDKVFLARPRRFGKTLLTSTFESLFKYGLRDFKGLAIERLWKDRVYDVVHLDLSVVNVFSDGKAFREKFEGYLARQFGLAGFSCRAGEPVIEELGMWLQQLPGNSLVCLIDEYDAPLTVCIGRKDLFIEVRNSLNEFFSILKSNEGCLRYFFMTGITKYSSTGIFSQFNILTDISLDIKYGTLLGVTEEEIKTNYGDYLLNAANVLHISIDELLDKMRAKYDGFSFDRKASTHVYNPWSVLHFLQRPGEGLDSYWYSSGGKPTALLNYLLHHELSEPSEYAQEKSTTLQDLKDPREYDDLDLTVLLTQTGYLTIKEVDDDETVWLGYPNEEVAASMAKLYAEKLLANKRIREHGQPKVSDVLKKCSVEEVVASFNRAVQAIDYQNYPIKDEASCRAYVQVLLIGAAMIPHVEVHSALGRSDMEIAVEGRHWVFEFKYAKRAQDVDACLNDAICQIKDRNYGVSSDTEDLIRVALVFCGGERKFSAFQVVR